MNVVSEIMQDGQDFVTVGIHTNSAERYEKVCDLLGVEDIAEDRLPKSTLVVSELNALSYKLVVQYDAGAEEVEVTESDESNEEFTDSDQGELLP